MELGDELYMEIEEKRKIYNFAEETKSRKEADHDEINGIVMAAETLATADPSLSWSRIPKFPKNSPQLQSASKAPECFEHIF